uniref:TRAF-type domain-containing protein n=2 Tax=Anopheles atroparvus TaxID=41427 RepID=A0AAG5DX91_ANOAO
MTEPVKAQLRFSKTSCYLCSEWLDDDEIEDHLLECSRKSVACPEGCGTVLARKNIQSHWKRCTKAFGETEQVGKQDNGSHMEASVPDSRTSPSIYDQVHILGEELQCMRLSLNEEMHQRAELMAQLQQLKRRSELADKWTAKVNAALVSFNKLVSHETNRRSVDVSGLEQRQNQLELWRLDLTTRFNSIESKSYISAESEPSYSLNEVSALQEQMDRVEHELLRLQAPEKLTSSDRKTLHISGNMTEANQQENGMRSSRSEESRTKDLERIKVIVEDVVEKHANIACRLQDALRQAFECEERVLLMAKQLEKYRRETYYTKQRLDALQSNLRLEEKLSALSSSDGRVIWRIDEFDKRFQASKDNDTMLKGPIFTNQPYGYVLQLEVSLYGIGTWRGRNLIAGLTVLQGSYDTLLQWPCMLTGTIRLRDQPDVRSNAMDICKPIVAKRKGQQTDKHQFVYVPHDVLRSRNFIRNDTIFLEVILDREYQEVAPE